MSSPTQQLHDAGQSLWLDNITRGILASGELATYVEQYTLTGLTSNPSIFDAAFSTTSDYDEAIAAGVLAGRTGENLFFDLAVEDLQAAADVFRPVWDRTDGVDGWVSLEVSPKLAYDAAATIEQAAELHARADRPNLFIKIPGTPEGLPAIEEAIFRGIPINVTLLFSANQYRAAADAYLRGVERRIEAGLNPAVGSVASVFMSRWDTAVADKVPAELANTLAIAVGLQTYRAYREILESARFARAANYGARMQRLLWASTGTKDPNASDTLYVSGLITPFTVNTMPFKTIQAFADHGVVAPALPTDGGDSEAVLAAFEAAGVDVAALAAKLQSDGAAAFVKSWEQLQGVVDTKTAAVATA
jgi:transaldolase